MNMDMFSGVFLGIGDDVNIPENLKNFLKIDDQGIEGLEFMLKHPNLSERIPDDVRAEYVAIYSKIHLELLEHIEKMRRSLDALQKDPTPIIHGIISQRQANDE